MELRNILIDILAHFGVCSLNKRKKANVTSKGKYKVVSGLKK